MPSRRILITGGSGFVGQWMCRRLIARGDAVFAGTFGQATGPSVLSDTERERVTWLPLDSGSDADIAGALDQSMPDAVVHLAGIAFAPDATAAPAKAFEVNALGAFRLLHALSTTSAKSVRILIVGSAEQYGAHPASEHPLDESTTQSPVTVYAASKAAQEVIALQMARSTGLGVVCTRSFNHSGFGQSAQFLLPSLVARVRALAPRGGVLRLGNETPVRDYLHVADVAAAYDALLERGQPGEAYNVSSGQGVTVRDVADRVLKQLGIVAEVSGDTALMRPVDVPVLVGDNAKLRAATGWAPRHTLDDIIDDLIHAKTR